MSNPNRAELEHDAIEQFAEGRSAHFSNYTKASGFCEEIVKRHLHNGGCKDLKVCIYCEDFQEWLDNQKLQ